MTPPADGWTNDQLITFLGILIYQKGGEVLIQKSEFERITSIIDNMHLIGTQDKQSGAIRLKLTEVR